MKSEGKILVAGDVMLDVYIHGETHRVSPEASCMVLSHCSPPEERLGGAANVAWQISLSGYDVTLWGCIGNDRNGRRLEDLLSENRIASMLSCKCGYATTTKTRFLSTSHQHLLRLDNDCRYVADREDASQLADLIRRESPDVLVLSDYDKGALPKTLCNKSIDLCRREGIPVIIDIKDNDMDKYRGASVLKGNRREFVDLFEAMGLSGSKEAFASNLRAVSTSWDCGYVVMTAGSDGIYAYGEKEGFIHVPGSDIKIHDVTGAGDIVTAFIAMLMARRNRNSFEDIIRIANEAAQKKVAQPGTGRVTLGDVMTGEKKQVTVFTNGCFDVFHAGHLSLLKKARQLGDRLIVGVNTDESVRRIKGAARPVNTLADRMAVLEALKCVDRVIPFEEDTPLRLIKSIRPDFLVKGADYEIAEIVGADFVKSYGGTVVTIPLVENLSSTKIIERWEGK